MKTILIVDDEYALADALCELLEHDGYRVVTAGNGQDGLARVQQDNPDLVITDLMMPIADGRELVRGMRAITAFRTTPVIMMTGAAKSVAVSHPGGALDVSAFLRKPFQWEKLKETITRLIGSGEKP